MTKELIEHLRTYESQLERDTADALEQQAKRIAELERATDHAIEINNALQSELEQQAKQIEELAALCDRLKQEAQIHAQEARTANATVAEIYQCVTGSTGEPGNWNGAKPVRDKIEELAAALAEKDLLLLRIASTTQTNDLLWWQIDARAAIALQPHASLVAKIKVDAVEEYIANESNKADERGFVYRLREYLSYDPETGVVTRKKDKYRAKAGSVVGHHDADGYLQMSFDNKTIKLHRIVWALHYGYMPEEVDHINRVRDDNRLSNLREVSRSQNLRNVSPRGQTGMVGVFKDGNRFKAQICENNIRRHLGCFETANEASDAYQAAAAKHYADRIERGEVK